MIDILFPPYFFIFLVICAAAFFYYRAAYEPFQFLKRNGFKGPKPAFFYGNYKEKVEKGYLKFTEECIRKFGPTYCTYVGTVPHVTTCDLELIKLVCIKDFNNFVNRPTFGDLMDKKSVNMFGLLQKRDQVWRTARNTISPTFSASKLKAMVPIMVEGAETLSKVLMDAAATSMPVDVTKIFGNYAMEILMHTAFGHPIKLQLGESDSLAKLASGVFSSQQETRSSSGQFLTVILSNLPWLRPFLRFLVQHSRRVQEYYLLEQLAKNLIKKRQQSRNLGSYKDFLQLLIEATVEEENGRKMTNDEITSHCILFMLAGYETTSTGLTYIAYLLALHPDIQHKLRQEIQDYYDQNPDSTPYQACGDIAYLEMVILECLRLYPPVSRFIRECSKDYHYKDMTIPAGTAVVIADFLVLKDPQYWDDPERFDPLRFTSEEKAKRPQHCYIPFGLGPRNCIGMRLSLLETKLALISLLRKVSFVACQETEVPLDTVVGITTVPKNGVFLKIENLS